jgi:cytochrome b
MNRQAATFADSAATTPEPSNPPLRDLPLRVFHWLTVLAVTAALVTGFLAPPWWQTVHVTAGYGLGVLLAFRILWGVFGSRFSRFRSFSLTAVGTVRYLRTVARGHALAFDGHNPAGTWMIVILLALLAGLLISGLILLGGQEKLGPLAAVVGFQTARRFQNLHEIAAWALLGAVALHLLGVAFETWVRKHPVLMAMVTGMKPRWKRPAPDTDRTWTRRGGALAALTGLVLIGAGTALSALPAKGVMPVRFPDTYKAECTDCHALYHPSLRTAAAWKHVMARLDEHYGEDASLSDAARQAITEFLAANSAETFDTEASWRIGRQDTASLRMTDTGYWKRRHRDIEDAAFTDPAVGSKANCTACHKDAETGLFADSEIHPPERGRK